MSIRTNYVTNPSFELNLNRWVEYNPSASVSSVRDTSEPKTAYNDTAKLRITNAIVADYGRVATETLPAGTYTASCSMATLSDCSNAVFVVRNKQNFTILVEKHLLASGLVDRPYGSFTLSTQTDVEILVGIGSYGPQSKGSATFDHVQIEGGPSLGLYFDGNFASDSVSTYAWTGSPNESRSTATTGGVIAPPTGSGGGVVSSAFNQTPSYYEEFTTPLDLNRWGIYDGPGSAGEGTVVPANVVVSSGELQLQGRGITGAGLAMRGGQVYGRWEVRLKMDRGKGFGPAVLLWPDSDDWNEGEIDFFENASGLADGAAFTDHKPGNPTDNSKQFFKSLDASVYHVYAVEWLADRISYFIDGVLAYEITDRAFIPTTSFHLGAQLDVGVAGGTLGIPVRDASTPTPTSLHIDYVKIYQPVTPTGAPPTTTPAGWSVVDADDFSVGTVPTSTRWTDYDLSASAAAPSGWNLYADPGISVASLVASTPEPTKSGIIYVRDTPGAKWYGIEWAPTGSEVGTFISAATSAGKRAMVIPYSIPNRDYGNASAGGAANRSAYETWWTNFCTAIGSSFTLVILEPDAIPLSFGKSADEQAARWDALSWAVQYFQAHCANALIYHDGGHSQWLSPEQMAPLLISAGVQYADGIAVNISNFRPDAEVAIYAEKLLSLLTAAGVTGKHYIVDTSRNGGTSPPIPADWENPPGRSLGKPSYFNPGSAYDAAHPLKDGEVWAKVPGESDGNVANDVTPNGHGGPAAGVLWPTYLIDLLSRSAIPANGQTGNTAGLPAGVANGELQLKGSGVTGRGINQNTGRSYGRYEIRTKIDRGAGYGSYAVLKSATSSQGEIRLLQSIDGTAATNTLYVRKPTTGAVLSQVVNADLTAYHSWAVEWLPSAITFYLDGVQVWQVTDTTYIPSAALKFDVRLEPHTAVNGIPALASATPQPFVFHADDFRVLTQSTTDPASSALETLVRQVWDGLKHRYIRVDGGVMQRESDNKITSEGQGYAVMIAAQLGDWSTLDLLESFNTAKLERRNGPRPTKGANLMAWDFRVQPFGSNPANTVNDWNFATDGDVDRAKGLFWAAARTGNAAYLNKALAIARDLKQFAFAVKGTKAYQASDEWQLNDDGSIRTNGGAVAGGVIEQNVSYIDVAFYKLAKDRANDVWWDQATSGGYDALTKVSNNTGDASLATTKGLFPDWHEYNFTADDAKALVSGTDGWTYTRSTDMKYDGFRTVHRLRWSYDWYGDAEALALLNGNLKTFYTAEWAAVSKIAAEYAHDGSRLSGGYEKLMMTAGAYMALTAGDPANATAAAMKTAKLVAAEQTGTDADGYKYWYPDDSTGTYAYFADFWAQMYFMREAGLWVNWGQTTGATGSVLGEVTDAGIGTDTIDAGVLGANTILDSGTSTDLIVAGVTLDGAITDTGSSVDLIQGDVPGQPEASPTESAVVVHSRERWRWIAPDRSELALTQFIDSLELIRGMSGRGMPPIEITRDVVPGQPGARTRSVRHGVRSMSIPLRASSGSWDELQALHRRLVSVMDPVAGMGTLRYIGTDDHVSDLHCQVVAGLSIDDEGASGPTNHKITLMIEAEDPYWYGETVSTGWEIGAQQGWFPILPLHVGSSSVTGSGVVIDTQSDTDVWPRWTIVGPGTEATLTNVTTGKVTAFVPGLVIAAGQIVEIDTAPYIKTVTGPGGSNWRKYLAQRALWPLIQGRNEVTIAMTGATTSSYLSVAYRPRTKMP